MSYFIPITDRGRRFARTFIYDGVGMDIWGIEWERMEQFAELNEYNITCLADAGILYARTPEDRERFEALRRRQAENLSNPVIMRANALQALEQGLFWLAAGPLRLARRALQPLAAARKNRVEQASARRAQKRSAKKPKKNLPSTRRLLYNSNVSK